MKKQPADFKRYTVTAALPYANGPLHLGHLAGAYLPADIYVRYLRLKGKKAIFVCGTDEHGAAISIKAMKESVSPSELVDKYYKIIRKGFEDFHISFDIFSRTSLPVHHETAQEFFMKFHKEGKLLEKTGEQLYDEKAGIFLADRYVTGTCPRCGHPAAYGDQCENCGSSLSPSDLINPRSTITDSVPVLRPTKHWFFPLDQYQEKIEKYILSDHDYWKPNVYGQCKSWLNDGLQPRAITRDLDWGVKVPGPPATDAVGKVLYVWFDAPIGYISATRHLGEVKKEKGEDFDWKEWWVKDNDTALIHFIGKDNIVFHCIIFPAMLMGHGEFNLPENVPANEFLNLEGRKLSTSRNWAVWLHEFIADFPGKADLMRYVIAATLPEQKDNDFMWKDFQTRVNNELVAVPGNFIRRVEVLTLKFYEGKVPEVSYGTTGQALLDEARSLLRQAGESIEKFRFREALETAMDIARLGNRYLSDTEPWKLHKSEPASTAVILNVCLQICGILSAAFSPFMPETAGKIQRMLQIDPPSWEKALTENLVPTNSVIQEAGILFEKVEDEMIEKQLRKLAESETQAAPASEEKKAEPALQKEDISFEEFQKLDLRIGVILAAESVPKADKLLKLKVDTGIDERTIVSGIAEFFKPEELPGKQVLVLTNLKPKTIRGIQSQGMILFAEDSNGKLHSVRPDQKIDAGSVVK